MRTARPSENGMSLIEVLVATAVMCVAVVVALLVYDASRAAFSKSENATEQQESVRIAFDKLTTELRMLGYNFNPDGNPDRPDEQLEGALDRAIVFRADFDRSDAFASVTPEAALAGGAFPTVSTGNDEIVAYVLSKPDGTGPDSITFQADVRSSPRDGAVESVTIGNIVLNPTAPPYTLYRVTLNNNPATFGSPSFIVRTPVAENIRDLKFTYYGSAGVFSDPSTSIEETAAAKAVRSGLTRVNVSLIGMTRQQDRLYNDPSDPAAPGYRKFELKGDVTPRNMRWKGRIDLNGDVTPPSKPATPTLIPGHCGGFLVSWAPNPVSDGATQYRLSWGTGSSVTSSRNVPGSPFFLDGLALNTTYSVSVQAQDAQGNISVRSDPASAAVKNLNTPSMPAGFTTSRNQTYHVAISWAAVTTNTTDQPPADPLAPRIRDLAGYRLETRSEDAGSLWYPLVHEDVLGPSFQGPYFDTPIVACLPRFYRLQAIDTCGLVSAWTNESSGTAVNAGVLPQAPTNVQAHYDPGGQTVDVKWNDITKDVSGQAIKIQRYEVFQSDPVNDGTPPTSWSAPPVVVYGPRYHPAPSPNLPPGKVVYYRVKGGDYCGNHSNFSDPGELDCTFSGQVEIQTPAQGAIVSGAVPVTVAVANPSGTYDQVTFKYARGGVTVHTSTVSNPSGSNWTDSSWTASPSGNYTITASVAYNGCWESATIDVTAAP